MNRLALPESIDELYATSDVLMAQRPRTSFVRPLDRLGWAG